MQDPHGTLSRSRTAIVAPAGLVEQGQGAASSLAGTDEELAFGDFRLLTAPRRLQCNGSPVAIGDKAFKILVALTARAGEVVGKAELLRQVWPDSMADEGALRFHISTLRKLLGEGRFIANVAGQGYSFVAPVSRRAASPTTHAAPYKAPLPPRRRPIGRDEAVAAISDQLRAHRFVTIVGPGGIGKTTVAVTVAHAFALEFDGDVCFFDIAAVFDPALILDGLASALGIPIQPTGALPGIAAFLKTRRMLLVLDGCEPAVAAVAAVAEDLFRQAPEIHLLATSREALQADGEQVHRLRPLGYPTSDAALSAAEALRFAAVRLFVDRATAGQHAFELSDEDAPRVGRICRKLDGLALAIELAAGRVEAYGVAEVERRLESQFALIWPGRRTAVARHQTLRAALDWSHQLLSEPERMALRRLSVFPGVFMMRMAAAVVPDADVSDLDVMELLASLVAKSLVQFEMEGARGGYRLLDTTRSYAAEKLMEAGEVGLLSQRHARWVQSRLQSSESRQADAGHGSPDLLGEVRAALEWSLSAEGDREAAASIAAASASLFLRRSLLIECRYWTTRALNEIDESLLGSQRRLTLQAALASALMFTQGFTTESFESWASTFAFARSIGDFRRQRTSLVVMWAHKIRFPDYAQALALARRADDLALAAPEPGTRANADWMVGTTCHHLGYLPTARTRLERSLAGDTREAREDLISAFGYDRRIPSLSVLSHVLWLQGQPDEAVRLGAVALAEARRASGAVTLCSALAWQSLNLHLRGDDAGDIGPLIEEGIVHARSHFIKSFHGLSLALKGLDATARGDNSGAASIAEGLELLSEAYYEVFHPLFRSECARLNAQAGLHLRDYEIESLMTLEAYPEHWATAEVRRNLGEVLLQHGQPDRAKRLFASAVECARRQGALAWELRAALSLARCEREPGPRDRARQALKTLRDQFAEGEATADLQAADRFLANRPH